MSILIYKICILLYILFTYYSGEIFLTLENGSRTLDLAGKGLTLCQNSFKLNCPLTFSYFSQSHSRECDICIEFFYLSCITTIIVIL